MDIDSIISENKLRLNALFCPYNPITGEGSLTSRIPINVEIGKNNIKLLLPDTMFSDPVINEIKNSGVGNMLKNAGAYTDKGKASIFNHIHNLRLDHDFEYFGMLCMKIYDKISKKSVPFTPRHPQRKLISEYEILRTGNLPIMVNLLKARQWGGSTATQLYMAWIQIRLMMNWHSVTCADIEDQSKNVGAMLTRALKSYPSELGKLTLAPFERSSNRIIKERGSIISIGSAQKPDKLRSFDNAMAHLSELGIWKTTEGRTPEELIVAITSSIYPTSHSFICQESTAKGVGNYWYDTCTKSMQGESDYKFVFVPWFDIEIYQYKIDDHVKFIQKMTEYDWYQWKCGATLEGINYYKLFKRARDFSDWKMKEEFPTTPSEAFQSSGNRAFEQLYVIQNRDENVRPPHSVGSLKADSRTGKEALNGLHFVPDDKGLLKVWAYPDKSIKVANRYLVTMDIGGKRDTADKTVFTVFDRYWLLEGGNTEVVARWRLNTDQDIAAWMGVGLAKWFNGALFAVEFNSLKNKNENVGEHSLTILDEIVDYYPNIYARSDPEKVKQGAPVRYGFHTNKKTKGLIIDNLNAALRDMTFVDPDEKFYNECDWYEEKSDGSYGSKEGTNDDILMTVAIGLWISEREMPMPYIIKETNGPKLPRPINEASF